MQGPHEPGFPHGTWAGYAQRWQTGSAASPDHQTSLGWWGRSEVEAEEKSVGKGPDHYGSYQSIDVAATEWEPFYNIAQAGTEWTAQSSDRAPGPMGKGFGQWRTQVHLVRATKAYLYTQALDTPFIKTTKF